MVFPSLRWGGGGRSSYSINLYNRLWNMCFFPSVTCREIIEMCEEF